MTNVIITSPHRVGSRWVHYLLADLYRKNVTPEIDGSRIKKDRNYILKLFKENKIVKFHGATQNKILKDLFPQNYKIIGIVRNPRDRAVSYAFHNRYHQKNKNFRQKRFKTDKEAVRYTVLEDRSFMREEKQQAAMMVPGYSTKGKIYTDMPYIWTCYEWLRDDPFTEFSTLVDFLEESIKQNLGYTIQQHSFKAKSGRKPGSEDRKDLWRRKGVVGDWENWFDDEMIEKSQELYDKYYERSLLATYVGK